ncbi:MAG TPA: ATP-binding protein, partial [Actinomycetota bacterium]|nr:ATP-binding protein [Actinomycetota bacterium]
IHRGRRIPPARGAMAADRRSGLPLTLRLAATYALLVAATLLVVAAVAVYLTRNHLSASRDSRLVALVESFREGPGSRITGAGDVPGEARAWLEATPIDEEQAVAIRTNEGRVLTAAGGLDLGAVEGSERLLLATTSRWWDLSAPEAPVRAITAPIVLDDAQVGTLVVAASREEEEETISALVSGVLWASGLGLAFATLLGVAAVRRTLRPLRRMSAEVDIIQRTGDLSRRVSTAGPRDEVGRLADAFDEMLARLHDAFSSQRRFVSDAAHELRTPLQIARGQLEFLEEGLRAAEPRRSLAVAAEELERMRRIVDDLLLLARLDEGLPLAREPVEVELVVREALLRGMVLARRESRVEVEPGLYAKADPDRLLQVLTNLVTNAVRHGGEEATIAITGVRTEDEVEISVSDTGPGIPPDELPHVFNRLYRGSTARTASPGGAGLGLAIAASLTNAMGGRIAVDSVVGARTTFTVWLPAMASDEAETIEIPG